jgi:hypothetical protein
MSKQTIQPGKRGRPTTVDWKRGDKIIGTMYDRDAAKILGCKILAVIRRRKLLRIPAYRSTLIA